MRLGSRRHPESTPPAAPARESCEQPSLALEHVVSRLAKSPRCGVLDLGPPVAENLALYRRHRAEITVADLYRFLIPLRPGRKPSRELFDELIPHNASTEFDLVLAWDVLNYLSLDEISALIESFRRYSTRSLMMFALISATCDLPASPSTYTVVDEQKLRREFRGPMSRPSPDYSEQNLLSRMPYTVVESRFHLRNQMIEFLFCAR